MATKCFLLLPTNKQRRSLRRYSSSSGNQLCKKLGYSYHNAQCAVGVFESENPFASGSVEGSEFGPDYPVTDSRWPVTCASCSYEFTGEDERQIFHEALWVRQDNGVEMTLNDAPPGAMWDAYWMPSAEHGPDGKYMIVKLPNGNHWTIDGRASNCNRPGEKHQCWTRKGVPPVLTVDNSGETCKVGAGSIGSGDYHGFLREGVLT